MVKFHISWYYPAVQIERKHFFDLVMRRLDHMPAVALLGPRQCGKTTLARQIGTATPDFNWVTNYFDLERATDLARLAEPETILSGLRGLVIIDEIQRRPDLFPTLRYLLDRNHNTLQFLILGSASREFIRQGSESLAGRLGLVEMSPFSLAEVGTEQWRDLWFRGGFPGSFLAKSEQASQDWLRDYITTVIETDMPALGLSMPPQQVRRLMMMVANSHAGHLNAVQVGAALGLSAPTVRRYVDFLAGTFLIRQLQPWFDNVGKRQVKSPKVYLRDTGVLHHLLGFSSRAAVEGHPAVGHSWEGFALEETCRSYGLRQEDVFFWAVHGQSELDMITVLDGKRVGFEFKFADAPRLTRSMSTAVELLDLDTLHVVYPGEATYSLATRIRAVPLGEIASTRPA